MPPSASPASRRLDLDDPGPLPPLVSEGVPQRRPLRIGIINNPLSGQNARHGLLAQVSDLLRLHPQVAHFEEGTFEGITAAVRELVQREVEILVVNGGDGTAQAVLTGMLRAPAERLPLIAVLPGGSTNTTARNVGYGQRPLDALDGLLRGAATGMLTGTVERRPVVRVDFDGEPQYALLFGAGAVYHGIVFARQQIESRGVRGQLGAGLALATFIGKVLSGAGGTLFPPLHAEIEIDGEVLPAETYFGILTSTIDRQILNISPYWGTGPGPLRFSSLNYRPRRLMRSLLPVLRGKSTPNLQPEFGYRSANADEIFLNFDSGFTLDGELFAPAGGSRRVRLSARQVAYFLRRRG